jgi:hypothetical protein
MTNRTSVFLFSLVLFAASFCQSQTVPYAFLTPPRQQFVDANGVPLAGGFLFSYAAGTSTPLATYHLDTLGNITANQNPIILDSTGSAEVRLLPQVYKFVLQNSSSVQVWAIDQISDVGQIFYNQAVLLNPVAGALQTIAGSLSVTALQIGGGTSLATSNQTGTGSLCLQSNCALITPIINTIPVTGQPGTYSSVLNSTSPGTTLNTLTKLTVSGIMSTGSIAATTDTGGVVGICVLNCGTAATPFATVQQSGVVTCLFDGATTANDYVQISSATAGDCHDAGATSPIFGQVLGRVGQTAGSAGLYTMDLFGPEIQAPSISEFFANGSPEPPLIKVVVGAGNLVGGTATQTFIGSAVFNHVPVCLGTDTVAANALAVLATSTSSVTITGTGTDHFAILCFGN